MTLAKLEGLCVICGGVVSNGTTPHCRDCHQSCTDQDLRLHLRALHCWEQDWIDGCTDEELKAQHLEAHDNAEKWEGIFNLHRIAYPHTYYDRRTVRP